jgi:hypothetical protein
MDCRLEPLPETRTPISIFCSMICGSCVQNVNIIAVRLKNHLLYTKETAN